MKKILSTVIILSCLLLLAYNVYSEIKAIDGIIIEINDFRIEEMTFSYILLDVDMKIVNSGGKSIHDLEGNFSILILNTSIGYISFDKIDISPNSSTNSSFSIYLYYDKVANSIIEVLEEQSFSISAKGIIKGKILFGLLNYERNIEIKST